MLRVPALALKVLHPRKCLNLRHTRMASHPTHLYTVEGHPHEGDYVLGSNLCDGLIHSLNETAEGDLISKFVDDTEL